jgi:uncharacterized protein YbjT (DUF2867 family)
MKVLIIGATGMLAKPVIENLDKKGHSLRLFSRSIEASMYDNKHETLQGDVMNPDDVQNAVHGCDAIHITLSRTDEAKATKIIVNAAKENNIKLITLISGSTVSEKNRWFDMIDKKFQAEQSIIQSGIPYIIFRPSWFYESLPMMIRNEKAMMIGTKPKEYSWCAASDYGVMVANAYEMEEAVNKIFYIHGPEKYKMNDLLEKYAQKRNLKNQKVKGAPIGMMKFIAFISGNKMLKMATNMFAYFEKVDEIGDPSEANTLLNAPQTTFDQWFEMNSKK